MEDIRPISPGELASNEPPPMEQFELQFLAQGDSWFSIGAMPPWLTTNLFYHLQLPKSSCVVNCASPGLELYHMIDTTKQRTFLNLLNGNVARRWTGLLISGGGNDLIDAAQSPPTASPDRRLLAIKNEWKDLPDGNRYISDAGWNTFEVHLTAVFQKLLAARDRGINKGIPLVCHTYDLSTPRNAPAGLGHGPWLYPSVRAFQIPEADWQAVSFALSSRLATLLKKIAANTDGTIHVVETLGTLTPAPTNVGSATEDWQNEIHPTRKGYSELAGKWREVLSRLFVSQPAGVQTLATQGDGQAQLPTEPAGEPTQPAAENAVAVETAADKPEQAAA